LTPREQEALVSVSAMLIEDCQLSGRFVDGQDKYEGESVNRSQMDMKCNTCDIQTLKKHLLLNLSSTDIDKLVPLLYKCIETQHIEVF
jgi:hypothetical protein